MRGYRTARAIGVVFRLVATLLILSVAGVVIWRVFFSAKIPKSVCYLQKNEVLSAAYAENGGNLTFRRQEQASITRGEKNNGYFSIVDCVFIPEAEQVQIVFRYNNSTIRHLAADYGLDAIPDKSADLFDVTLLRTTDLTPDDASDNGDPTTFASERIHATSATRAESALYTFYRIVFDGVSIESDTEGIFSDIYYLGALDYSATPYGTLCLYASGDKWISRPLSAGDRVALGE